MFTVTAFLSAINRWMGKIFSLTLPAHFWQKLCKKALHRLRGIKQQKKQARYACANTAAKIMYL